MCKLKKIYQQTFSYAFDVGTSTKNTHNFQRVYKTSSNEYFKMKVIGVQSTDQLFMEGFAPFTTVSNYEVLTVVNAETKRQNKNLFYLGNQAIAPEVLVDEIPLSPFNITNAYSNTLNEYTIVFQIELWEHD